MDRSDQFSNTSNTLSLRRLLPALLVLLASLLIGAAAMNWQAQQSTTQQSQRWAESLGRSTAILVQPLLLADDRISLNYLFNELQSHPLLNGLKLTDPRHLVVAVAGNESGLERNLVLTRGEETLGELSLWIDNAPLQQPLQQQLTYSALTVGIALLLSLLTLAYSLHSASRIPPARSTETEADDAPVTTAALAADASFDAYRASVPTPLDNAPEPDTLSQDSVRVSDDDYPLDLSLLQDDAPVSLEQSLEPPAQSLASTGTDHAETVEPASPMSELTQTAVSAEPAPADTELRSTTDTATVTEDSPAYATVARDSDSTADLVDLLKPDHQAPQMPHFIPSERDPESDGDAALAPEIDQVEFDDETDNEVEPGIGNNTANLADSKPRLSLVGSPLQGRNEEQLGLYTLEHELELLLAPQEAGYLFLIDTTSAHADNIEESERNTLLRHYRTLANSAAHIYSGRVDALPDGDLQLYFDEAAADDSHGINALCSALLFTGLYKQYNQHRIRQFKPVMNLHMSVVRGRLEQPERLLEEARFLTRTTQSNELISHTALTEAPDLKESLLEGADIRREDEDKVLIMRVSRSYQELLDKQARYLLSKLLNREQEQQSPAQS